MSLYNLKLIHHRSALLTFGALSLCACSTGPVATDAPTDVTVDRPGQGSDAFSPNESVSRAGQPCDNDNACGRIHCDRSVRGGMCTADCVNSDSLSEATFCGGPGSTCLAYGDGETAVSRCAKSCRATMNSGCRPGFVCTGHWYSHAAQVPDTPGCAPFCTLDTHCMTGERCNSRTGRCGQAGVDLLKLADGQPCRTTPAGEPSECRGFCRVFEAANPAVGLCASFIDLSVTQSCPDDPTGMQPEAQPGRDNLALCMKRNCSDALCCPSGLLCEALAPAGAECSPIDHGDRANIACNAMADAGSDAALDGSGDASDDVHVSGD